MFRAGDAHCRSLRASRFPAPSAAGAGRLAARRSEATGPGPARARIGRPGSGDPAPGQPQREVESHSVRPHALRRAGGGAGRPSAVPQSPRPSPRAPWRCCFRRPEAWAAMFSNPEVVLGAQIHILARLRGPAASSLATLAFCAAPSCTSFYPACALCLACPPPAPSLFRLTQVVLGLERVALGVSSDPVHIPFPDTDHASLGCGPACLQLLTFISVSPTT